MNRNIIRKKVSTHTVLGRVFVTSASLFCEAASWRLRLATSAVEPGITLGSVGVVES